MENLNKVVKEIKIVAKPSKRGGKNHFVRVELINGRSADVWCDKEVVELIQTCTELGVEPFKSFTLEKRTSEKNGAEYIAVVLKMFNDVEYFYFLPARQIPLSNCYSPKPQRTRRQRPPLKRRNLWQTLKYRKAIKAHTQPPPTVRQLSLWYRVLTA